MKIFSADSFVLPLPAGHRFPMAKYRLLRERVEAAALGEVCVPPAATDAELARAHSPAYIARVVAGDLSALEVRRIGFPWSPALVERSRRSTGATIAACRAAREDGVGVNLAGGTHHAGPDWGQGYCVFNDAAVAARVVGGRVLVLDCDVHQGNGTAAIGAGDPELFTFSIHGENNFPFNKTDGDLDLALPDGTGDAAYLGLLEQGVQRSFDRARPDLVIYLSGADPFAGDTLGRLALTKNGLAARDRYVLDACRERSVPVAVTMGGGYARDVHDTVDIHFRTVASC